MMDEIEMDRQKALQGWDRQSCAEWEAFLDEMHDDAQDRISVYQQTEEENQDYAEPPCTCYYTDVDVVENRYCEAHGLAGKEF